MRSFHRAAPSAAKPTPDAPTSVADRFRSGRGRLIALAPLVTGVLALAALATVPWAVNSKLTIVRSNMNTTLFPARKLVQDYADALALEMAARKYGATNTTPELVSRYAAAAAIERARDSALSVMAPRLGTPLAADIAQLHALAAQWHADVDDTTADVTVTDILAVARRLDEALAARQAIARARIESLEGWNVVLTSILVPLLGAVLLAIFWTARQLAALAKEAEESRLALAIASEQKATLLRGLTHDLKNALGAAGGFAILLRDEIAGPLTVKQRHAVERIGHIIEQTMISVQDALLVARTEAGTLPLRYHTENARALVGEAAADFVAAAERAHLTLTFDCADDLPAIETDGALVSKIIGNLLSNAIKYTPADGRISVRCLVRPSREGSTTGPWVAIEVHDTGAGIPVALHEKVFEEFFRAPTATSSARGEGIGLATSRRMARLLGGEITLDSEDGHGAIFTLWLPASARETARTPQHGDPASRLDGTLMLPTPHHPMKEALP
jgi:signal transduction histidine kinase